MDGSIRLWLLLLITPIVEVFGQGQQCYWGPGAKYRAPANVIPCNDDGPSTCCMEGDTCLSGNACWSFTTGDTYQYGCTDATFTDPTCPQKCGWSPDKSPWTALEYCNEDGIEDTWVCHSPESCGCNWDFNYDLLYIPLRGCAAMGSEARVALYAPNTLAPWALLPNSTGGTTAYFTTYTTDGTLTWVSTAIADYTPSSIGPYVTYDKAAPTTPVVLFAGSTPDPATLGSAHLPSVTPTYKPISALPSTSGSTSSSSPATTTTPPTTTTSTPQRTSTGTTTTSSSSPSATASPSGLSTGAKAGVGVGVAGGVIAVAAIALFFLWSRRRKRQSRVSTGSGPDEKYASWQGQPYPPGGSPHGYHYNQGYQYQGVPAIIHEATYSPEDEQTINKRLSPPQPLAEMEGGHVFPEADSRSPSRSRGYEDTDIAKRT